MAEALKKTKETRHASRKFKAPKYKSFRIHKRIRPTHQKVPSVKHLVKRAFQLLIIQPRPVLGVTLVYAILALVFVRSFSGGLSALELKDSLDEFTGGEGNSLSNSVAVFGVLLGSASATDGDLASLYQTIIMVLVGLAFIWVFRQVLANPKQRVTTKQAFYLSTTPVIPFVIVLFVMSLQLIPIAIANILYSFVIIGGFAASSIEIALWYLMMFLLVLLSFYMLSSSIFALFIVTLPETTPMQALRAARELVRYRRWTVMRKVLLLPIVLIVLLAVVTLPSILIVPAVAEWIFFAATIMMLPILISYMYGLYRSLL